MLADSSGNGKRWQLARQCLPVKIDTHSQNRFAESVYFVLSHSGYRLQRC